MVLIHKNNKKEIERMKFNRITTIKISKQTVLELYNLKIHPRQSYEEVIVKLLENYKEKTRIGIDSFREPSEITTIKVSKRTVLELYKLKIHPRQSYEEVVVKLLENYKKISSEKNEN